MTAWREGYQSVLDGEDDGGFANPYPAGTRENLDWSLGWCAAWEDEIGCVATPSLVNCDKKVAPL
jgi:hypothetical protein